MGPFSLVARRARGQRSLHAHGLGYGNAPIGPSFSVLRGLQHGFGRNGTVICLRFGMLRGLQFPAQLLHGQDLARLIDPAFAENGEAIAYAGNPAGIRKADQIPHFPRLFRSHGQDAKTVPMEEFKARIAPGQFRP